MEEQMAPPSGGVSIPTSPLQILGKERSECLLLPFAGFFLWKKPITC
jgi:hypothetical protein